jgi:hypothetical protein
MNSKINDKKILELWRSPSFSGSYRGIKTFKVLLFTDLHINVSESYLYNLLKKDPIFLIHTRPRRKINRRKYDLRFYGELCQADIAYMFEYDGFKYFLVLIDCYSSKLFVKCLKNKDSLSVSKALAEIITEFGAQIHILETDQGKEFLGQTKVLLKKEKIFYKQKFGLNKSNFAENAIYIIKKRLYMLLRGTLSHNWVDKITQIVEDYNNTPIKKLGWLTPNSIHSEYDSVKVEAAQKEFNIKPFREPNFHVQLENQQKYEKDKSKLQVNDFVYLDFNEKLFDKSFDVQV